MTSPLFQKRFCHPVGVVTVLLFTALVSACAPTVTYVVRPGDTMREIALAHDIALSDLVKANRDRYPNLELDPESIEPGMELVIPVEGERGLTLETWFAPIARAASPPVTPMPAVPAAPNEKINTVIQLIQHRVNRERTTRGLNPLVFDTRLYYIAQQRSFDMIRRRYFSHNDPVSNRVAFQELIRRHKYHFVFVGENIAEIKNQSSRVHAGLTVYARYGPDELAEQFVSGWLNSAEHRANILNPYYARTGIALGVSLDGTRIVATQIFADSP